RLEATIKSTTRPIMAAAMLPRIWLRPAVGEWSRVARLAVPTPAGLPNGPGGEVRLGAKQVRPARGGPAVANWGETAIQTGNPFVPSPAILFSLLIGFIRQCQ